MRPLAVGEILDGAIATIRDNPKVLLGLTAIIALVANVLGFAVTEGIRAATGDATLFDSSSDEFATAASDAVVFGGPTWVISSIAVVLLTGILTIAVSRSVLGRRLSASESWDGARPRLVPLLLASLLYLACIAVVAVILLVPAGLLLSDPSGQALGVLLLIPGIPLLIVTIAYANFMFSLAAPVIVLENAGPVAALRRTARLLKGIWWRSFGIWLLVAIMSAVIGVVLTLPFGVLQVLVTVFVGDDAFTAINAISAVGSTVSSTVTWPFSAAATTLIYLDVRMRREGLDLALQHAVTPPQPTTPHAGEAPYGSLPGFPGQQPPPAPQGWHSPPPPVR